METHPETGGYGCTISTESRQNRTERRRSGCHFFHGFSTVPTAWVTQAVEDCFCVEPGQCFRFAMAPELGRDGAPIHCLHPITWRAPHKRTTRDWAARDHLGRASGFSSRMPNASFNMTSEASSSTAS